MVDLTGMPCKLDNGNCESKDELKATHIATIPTRIDRCACAVNINSNWIIIYQQQGPRAQFWKFCLSILTSDGYFVTSIKFEICNFISEIRTVRFTDDMIIICGKKHGLTIFSTFFKHPLHSQKETFFIEFDEKGNIYTNGYKTNEIVVYAPNWEFRRKFSLNLPNDATIESMLVRNNSLVITAKHESFFNPLFLIHRFDLSTLKPLGYSEILERFKLTSPVIYIDRCNNILAETRHGICIWMYKGRVWSIKFENGDNLIHARFMITGDSRIIRVTTNGTIEIHQLILPI